MKKIVALLLVLVIMFALCGCGGNSTPQETNTAAENNAENDFIKIEEVKIISAEEVWQEKDLYVPDFKITCLCPSPKDGSYPDTLNINYAYLDGEGAVVQSCTVQVYKMMYGDTVWASSYDSSYTKDKLIKPEQYSALKFIGYDVFWGSAGGFKQYNFENPQVYDIAELMSATGVVGGGSVEPLSIGETIQTDILELTLKECVFQGGVDIGNGISLAAYGDDMILACLSLEIKNISKETLEPKDLMDVLVDYNEGYIYSTRDKSCYFTDDNGNVNTFTHKGASKGAVFKLSPLASEEYILTIPCTNVVGEDKSSPLKIVFTLPNGGSSQDYEYVIR